MRSLLLAAALASLAGVATASCPNLCSGHGSCGSNDICECFATWTGNDCSLRQCAYGKAWAANSADPHSYVECSGQGTCDTATGECACYAGFTGRACSRMACPNSCSGHGKCVLITDMDNALPYPASNWDATRIETCDCDAGFGGPDCSQRFCPTGDDPLTACSSTHTTNVQEVRFRLGSALKHDLTTTTDGAYTYASEEMDLFGTSDSAGAGFNAIRGGDFQMRVAYVDSHGGKFVAHAVSHVLVKDDATIANPARDSLEVALESLPEAKVHNVSIDTALTSATTGGIANVLERRFLVTFQSDATNSNNVGLQNALVCDSGYSCSDAGCQPKVTMPFLYRYAGMTASAAVGASVSIASAAGTGINFFTGDDNAGAAASAFNVLRLNADSQPQMPLGVAIDDSVTSSSKKRYDIRILVAVVDPVDTYDTAVDVYYTRVIVGYDNITSTPEQVGGLNAWTGSSSFTTTLHGFTFNGPIPSSLTKVAVPGAPGAYLTFPSRNMVSTDGEGRWYEILIKLPVCSVQVATAANAVHNIDYTGNVAAIDENVENIECSGRGLCNRNAGTCTCFAGFSGIACQAQSALV